MPNGGCIFLVAYNIIPDALASGLESLGAVPALSTRWLRIFEVREIGVACVGLSDIFVFVSLARVPILAISVVLNSLPELAT